MMLFYKAWRESRARFVVIALTLAVFCAVMVLFHEQIRASRNIVPGIQDRTYTEHIYRFIYGTAKGMVLVLFLPFLGLGGLLREKARGTASFTLALPVSRLQLVGAHLAVGLLELAALALLPALLVPAMSLLVHQSYPLSQALHFSVLWFVCGAEIFATAFLFSAVLSGEYTAPVACYIVFFIHNLVFGRGRFLHATYRLQLMWVAGEFGRMHWNTSHTQLLSGPLPWLNLLLIALISLCLFAVATRITQHQDV
jgi:ABC-2 type transport system permease protein